MTSTWLLVIWVHVAPPQKPILLEPKSFETETACQIEGEKEFARLGPRHIWFCIQLREPAKRRREA